MSTCTLLQHKLQTLHTELQHVPDDQAQQKILDEIDSVLAQMQAQGQTDSRHVLHISLVSVARKNVAG